MYYLYLLKREIGARAPPGLSVGMGGGGGHSHGGCTGCVCQQTTILLPYQYPMTHFLTFYCQFYSFQVGLLPTQYPLPSLGNDGPSSSSQAIYPSDPLKWHLCTCQWDKMYRALHYTCTHFWNLELLFILCDGYVIVNVFMGYLAFDIADTVEQNAAWFQYLLFGILFGNAWDICYHINR